MWHKIGTCNTVKAEHVDIEESVVTQRMEVPGGWLVRSFFFKTGNNGNLAATVAQSFVPDTKHEWVVEK